MNDNIARGRIASSLQDCSLNSGGSPITNNKRHQQRQAISSACTRGIAAKAGNILEFSYNSENLALNPAIIGSDQGVGNRQRGSIVDNKTANPHETFLRLWMPRRPRECLSPRASLGRMNTNGFQGPTGCIPAPSSKNLVNCSSHWKKLTRAR